ncbi:MAG TPA: hypothetical protein VKB76_09820 [Ktedonobacterales bacterium]|nr:hypothetical protein [Ktedonobacterales bacterium]
MWYNFVLFAHVAGAIGLFSANSLAALGTIRMRQGQTIAQIRDGVNLTAGASRGIPISSLLILLSAIFLVLQSWSFATPWVLAALITMVLLAVGNNALNGRRMGAIRRAANTAPDGPISSQLQALVRHPMIWFGVTVSNALLIGVVFLMTVKPDLTGTLITLGVALALGIVLGAASSSTRPSQQSGATTLIAPEQAARS